MENLLDRVNTSMTHGLYFLTRRQALSQSRTRAAKLWQQKQWRSGDSSDSTLVTGHDDDTHFAGVSRPWILPILTDDTNNLPSEPIICRRCCLDLRRGRRIDPMCIIFLRSSSDHRGVSATLYTVLEAAVVGKHVDWKFRNEQPKIFVSVSIPRDQCSQPFRNLILIESWHHSIYSLDALSEHSVYGRDDSERGAYQNHVFHSNFSQRFQRCSVSFDTRPCCVCPETNR